jgi:dihydropyrimidinase
MKSHNLLVLFTLFLISITFTVQQPQGVNPEDIKLTSTTTSYLIRNGLVVNVDQTQLADVLIEDGIIVKVEPNIIVDSTAITVIDATGKFVLPGGIDPHVHLELPFMGTVSKDDFETGTKAALAGGTTMIMDFAIPPPRGSHINVLKEYLEKASHKAACDYTLHIGIVYYDGDDGTVKKEMEQIVNEYQINSFKFFMAYKNAFMINDEELVQAMRQASKLGAISMVHCENGELVVQGQQYVLNELNITGPEGHPLSRPAIVEAEAVHRASVLANFANAPLYVVHVMSKEAMQEVARAKQRGWRIVGEPISAGLTLDDSYYNDPDWDKAARYVMSPPLRKKQDQIELIHGLKNKVLDLIGTDHCSFDSKQKRMGYNDFTKIPNGLPVIEHRMITVYDKLVHSGHISINDYVRVTSTEAAQIFNIYPRKGKIAPGSDADVIILNPNSTTTISAKTHHHNVDYSVYEGQEFHGKIESTFSRGRLVWHNDQLNVEKGSGRFIPTPPFGKMFNGLEREIETLRPRGVTRS